jgi:hypothetical protein
LKYRGFLLGMSVAVVVLAAAAGCDVRVKVLDPPGSSGATWTAEPARMADAVVDAIAVGVHLGATTTPAGDNYALAKQRLGELGVRHVIDPSMAPDLLRVQELSRMTPGIRSQIWIDTLGDYFRAALATGAAIDAFQIDPLATAAKLDEAWLQGRRSFCGDLFAAVKGVQPNPVAVAGPDVDFPSTFPLVDFGPCVDLGTVHRQRSIGPPTGQSIEGFTLDQQIEAQRTRAIWRAQILAGDGYSTKPGDLAGAVSELVQSKYLGRLVFEAFNRDFVRVFVGGITDRPDDEQAQDDQRVVQFGGSASGFLLNDGLSHFDGTPKPSFQTMRNLIAVLADPGTPFNPNALTYRIQGADESLHHTLLQKRDGAFFLALWLERPSTDAKVALPITVRFPSSVAEMTTFLPSDAADSIDRLKDASALAIDIGDQVTIVRIAPYPPSGGSNFCDRSKWKATASVLGDGRGPPGALDGNLTTRWDTKRLQDGTDFFQVDFGGPVSLTNITLNNTQAFPADYPGAYEVYGSVDGVIFGVTPFASGAGVINATVINFTQRMMRAVKVKQVGVANNIHWWGIGEFQATCSM